MWQKNMALLEGQKAEESDGNGLPMMCRGESDGNGLPMVCMRGHLERQMEQ